MKILSGTLLRDHYDVIVIGAGLGGMTAAMDIQQFLSSQG
jgi:succinate dehydrogenase/fumarate reductase flavoprotein subunit